MGRPLGVGLVGCGNVALNFHIPAYLARSGDVRVVAAADPVQQRLDAVRDATGLPEDRAFADYRDLIRLPEVDVVDVCVPQRFHAGVAALAVAAGKHVLCEKPITTIPAEAAALLEDVAGAGIVFGMMHNYLWFPELAAARRVIDSGEIGPVRLAIVNYLGVPDLPGADGSGWRHDPAAAGGGVLMDMLHAVYVAEHLLARRALRVSAHVTASDAHPRVESSALCRLETDGPVALVNVGWGVGPGGIMVEGERGRLEIRYRDGGTSPFAPFESLVVHAGGATRREALAGGEELVPLVISAIGGVIDDFVSAVRAGGAPRATGADGLHILELVLAAYESAATGRTVPVPLQRDAPLFTGGASAVGALPGADWIPALRQGLFTSDPSPR